jgi:hypothetical protein
MFNHPRFYCSKVAVQPDFGLASLRDSDLRLQHFKHTDFPEQLTVACKGSEHEMQRIRIRQVLNFVKR